MNYTGLLAGDVPVAGLMTLPKEACAAGAKPGWIGYIGVDDVDATAGRVTKAGGRIHVPPTDIPNVGRFAMVADPQGTAFCLFKPAADMTRPGRRSGQAGHRRLARAYAVDGEKAFGFYADLFGWTKVEAIDMGAMGRYQLFAAGGAPIGGMMTKPPGVPVSFWNYYFQVDAIGAAMERLKKAGGRSSTVRWKCPAAAGSCRASIPRARCSRWSALRPERVAGSGREHCIGCGRAGCARGRIRARPIGSAA